MWKLWTFLLNTPQFIRYLPFYDAAKHELHFFLGLKLKHFLFSPITSPVTLTTTTTKTCSFLILMIFWHVLLPRVIFFMFSKLLNLNERLILTVGNVQWLRGTQRGSGCTCVSKKWMRSLRLTCSPARPWHKLLFFSPTLVDWCTRTHDEIKVNKTIMYPFHACLAVGTTGQRSAVRQQGQTLMAALQEKLWTYWLLPVCEMYNGGRL